MRIRSVLAATAASAVAALGLAVSPALAEPVGQPVVSPLSAEAFRMWQTDETVWALAYSQGVLYAGGTFNTVRPPGAALGTDEVGQARIAAFDADTGAFITSWRPSVTGGSVYALDVSPDGSRLYVGGNFTRVDGVTRNRAAAFDITDPRSPQLVASSAFRANLNGKVNDIDSTNESVWLGGTFTTASGLSRPRVAAYDVATGELSPFRVEVAEATAPQYTTPFVSTLEQSGGRLYIGGMFNQVNGAPQHALAAVDASTGATDPGFTTPAIIPAAYVVGAQVSEGRLFIVGRADRTGGDLNRLEGAMALDAVSGQILWGSNGHRCLGDTFAIMPLHGVLWTATHAHDCSRIGGHPETRPRWYAAVLGQDPASGELAHFFPQVTGKWSVAGSLNNARAFATDGQRLFVGGGWTTVQGIGQQNLTVFEPRTSTSMAPNRVTASAQARSTGGAAVSWRASADDDDRTLTYTVYRRASNVPLGTLVADSTFWNRPQLSFVDRDVVPGESVYYRVSVSDGTNTVMSTRTSTITIPAPPANYQDAVLADTPSMYWRLNDPAGSTTVADASGNGSIANVSGAVVLGHPGALTDPTDQAAAFAGGHLFSSGALANPQQYALEAWFNTTTTTGGKIVGLGNAQTGDSSMYDRQLYMTNSGQLIYGTYTGSVRQTILSPTAYNDGAWHHAVITQGAGGMRLYVDGVLVGTHAGTVAQNYIGYVRVGGDRISTLWPSSPTSSRFSGLIDEVAYYGHTLDEEQVVQHYRLR